MQRQKKKTGLPFWAQILAILLVGVLASGAVLLFAPKQQKTTPEDNTEKYSVTFAYQDGTVIETKTVKKGKGVFPPAVEGNGVFRGWSGGFNAVTANVEVHPVFYGIKEENLFCFDSVYVKENTEFSLDLYVGGVVSLSSGIITLSYDTDVLEFRNTENPECVDVTEKKPGELTIQVHADHSFREETLLSKLVFFAKVKDAYSTQIDLAASDVNTIANGKVISANYATINNKIFFLQEVEE